MAIIGSGVFKGMGVTFKTLLETYPWGRVMLRMMRIPSANGLVTVCYPETKQQHHERFRVFPFLVYDKSPDDLRCVACKICEQECPPQCIFIVMEKDEQQRPVKAFGRTLPRQFDIDTSICMSCRICVDVCPFDAIEMDNAYEVSETDRNEPLIYDKEKLLRSNEYFREIKPTEYKTVEERLAPKRAKVKAAAEAAKAKQATPEPPTPPPSPQSS